ncbi:helix-turn-helix transcriptional regulator [Streptomyces sp. NBC_00102]|uniref:helix-turn-helix transcriptional regulator n=1 Tax=Streptomyces sp. NBC_00102 TaxID=2975652 RepID=UPI00225AC2A7|nr:helix-turn-helix transcriptional regulator [Streptomyces sp. NBC_00102]MCX5398959.1 helix-turn-helix domain-containing protein [Streptomyces sp. NBC_00102]
MDHWAGLGDAFKAARATLKLTQSDIMEALDVSRATVQNVERGKAFTRPTSTHRAYARLVGWTEGSVDQVLAGGEPTPAAAATPGGKGPGGRVPDDLPLHIAEELASGRLLDTAVIRMPGGGQAVVVARGREGGSPEELQASLEAWRLILPQLQELGERAGGPGRVA